MIDYRLELLSEIWEDMDPLTEAHWDEVPCLDFDMKFELNKEKYGQLEEMGYVRVATAREDGVLVGYFVVIADEPLHHKDTWVAVGDVIYVAPDYRSKGVAGALIKLMEDECAKDGIQYINIVVNTLLDFGGMLGKVGYRPTETTYMKKLGE